MEEMIKDLFKRRDTLSEEIVAINELLSVKFAEFQTINAKIRKIRDILKDK